MAQQGRGRRRAEYRMAIERLLKPAPLVSPRLGACGTVLQLFFWYTQTHLWEA
jgi:hypothetical protein